MRKGVVTLGVIFLIVGILLAIIFYPLVGYDDASTLNDKTAFGLTEYTVIGDVESIYKASDVASTLGLPSEIGDTLDDVAGGYAIILVGGPHIVIYTDNPDLKVGDKVAVKGYIYGAEGWGLLQGKSLVGSLVDFKPKPADVQKVPMPGFYIGLIVAIIGVVIALVGYAPKPKKEKELEVYSKKQGYRKIPEREVPYSPMYYEKKHGFWSILFTVSGVLCIIFGLLLMITLVFCLVGLVILVLGGIALMIGGALKKKVTVSAPQQPYYMPPTTSSITSRSQKKTTAEMLNAIEKLAQLRDDGIITEDEFIEKKKQILDKI